MSLIRWPGLIDVHVHLREPGATHKEDFATGSRSAVKGGFTYILDMPNNLIPTVTAARLKQKINLAKKKAVCPIGFHFGTNGKNLEHFELAARSPYVFGLKLYCNHTTGEMLVEDINLLTKVFAAWPKGKPILVHAEGVQLAAVIALSHVYGRKLHVCHISQAVEVELVKKAKKSGLSITAGVTPHHLYLPKDQVMKPPLGTVADAKALWRGLNEGTIDLIESDHAPHTKAEKRGAKPAFGVPGLETTLGLMLLAVKQKKVKLGQVKKWLYDNPRKIFHIPAQPKTYIEFDPDKPYRLREQDLATKCAWSPFTGWTLYGKVETVMLGGKNVSALL